MFCAIERGRYASERALMRFQEKEGDTLILKNDEADRLKVKYAGLWSMITLNVHSSLEAVGFLAKITKKLAKKGISVNAVSAFYHDHLFVLEKDSEDAMKVLKKLSGKL